MRAFGLDVCRVNVAFGILEPGSHALIVHGPAPQGKTQQVLYTVFSALKIILLQCFQQ